MTKKGNPFANVRLVYQRSQTLTKVVVLVALVLSMAALLTLGIARRDAEKRTAELLEQARQLEQENSQLERYIDELGTVQSVERIAAEELGLLESEDVVSAYLDKAEALLETPSLPHNGNYAFVCEKCAPTCGYFGRFAYAQELRERSEEIYAGN